MVPDKPQARPGEIEALSEPVPGEGPPAGPESPASSRPAMSITIQSWATPVIGLAMLALGLLTGYLGRPLVDSMGDPSSHTTASSPAGPNPAVGASDDQEARQKALMEAIIPQTVHFKGNPEAPVTLIEFSDFQ